MSLATANLKENARLAGLKVGTYSPGDGITRYRFYTADTLNADYFADSGLVTVLGRKNAQLFIFAFALGAGVSRT